MKKKTLNKRKPVPTKKAADQKVKKMISTTAAFKADKDLLSRVELLSSKGLTEKEIYTTLGITLKIFATMKKKHPDLRLAIKSGREKISDKSLIPIPGPKNYDEKYCIEMIKYFDIDPYIKKKRKVTLKDGTEFEEGYLEVNDLPLLSGFAYEIGVHRETLKNWAEAHSKFGYVYQLCKEIQDRNLITNGLKGLYNGNYANLLSKNFLGFKDKKDITTDNKPIEVKNYEIPSFTNDFNEPDDEPDNSISTEDN